MRLNIDAIKLELAKKGWTLQDLADELNITRAGLNVVLHKGNKRIDTVRKIANALGLSGSEIDKIVIKEKG